MSDFDLYILKKYLFIPLLVLCTPILLGPALQCTFEESFKPKPGCWGGKCHSCPKLTQKMFFWPHTDSGFCGPATQNTAKITLDWLKAHLMEHCPRKPGLPAQN
jgi:hypothetical protein